MCLPTQVHAECLFPKKLANFSTILFHVFMYKQTKISLNIPKFSSKHQHFPGKNFPNSLFFPTMCMWTPYTRVSPPPQLGISVYFRLGSQFTTGTIGYDGGDWRDGYDEIYFKHDARKFKINITSIRIDDGADLIHLINYPLEKYWSIDIALLLDSCPLHLANHFTSLHNNPLHKVALQLTTTVIHLVEYNSHFGIM